MSPPTHLPSFKSLLYSWNKLPFRRSLPIFLAASVSTLLATQAFAQTVNYYSGTDSAGYEVDVYTTPFGQGTAIYSLGITGNKYCNGILIPGVILGGTTDGTELHQIVDGRSSFSELRPDYYLAADLRVSAKKVQGSATFKQATYTGPDFPPRDRDSTACTTKKLTFTATYIGSVTLNKR